MTALHTILLGAALAPPPPAVTCPCEITDWRCRSENPICKETQTVPNAPTPAPVVVQPARPAADPEVTDPDAAVLRGRTFRANGGYVLANAAGVALHAGEPWYMWGLEGGGWISMEKPLALGIGFKLENEPGFDLWRFGIPFRLSVGNHYVSAYALFTPSLARIDYICASPDEIECSKENGLDIQLGGGLMLLLGRGFLLGFEPSFNHGYWDVDVDDSFGGTTISVQDTAFTFRTWMGWKFGKGTID